MEKGFRKNKGLLKNPLEINPGQILLQITVYSIGVSFTKSLTSILITAISVVVLFLYLRKFKIFILIIPFLIFIAITYYFFSRSETLILNSLKILLPVLYALIILYKSKYQTLKYISFLLLKIKLKYLATILEETVEYTKKLRKDKEEEIYNTFDTLQLSFLLLTLFGWRLFL